MEDLHSRIIQILEKSPADQFSVYRQLKTVTLVDLSRAVAQLQEEGTIHIVKYRRSKRIGTNIPVYSLNERHPTGRPDLVKLLPGVTSERIIEYEFLARNLVSSEQKAVIVDFGSYWRELDLALNRFSEGRWHVIGIDIERGRCDVIADLRFASLRTGAVDEVICISTLEHVGLSAGVADVHGDQKAIAEIYRVLRKGGIAVLTVPYGSHGNDNSRIYGRHGLQTLLRGFAVTKKEFYSYLNGRWNKCSQAAADKYRVQAPFRLHSSVCACIVLTKR